MSATLVLIDMERSIIIVLLCSVKEGRTMHMKMKAMSRLNNTVSPLPWRIFGGLCHETLSLSIAVGWAA